MTNLHASPTVPDASADPAARDSSDDATRAPQSPSSGEHDRDACGHDHSIDASHTPFGGWAYRREADERAPRTGLRNFLIYRVFVALLLFPIHLYQVIGRRVLPPMCRYEPSCSDFMIQAIRQKGAVVGILHGLFRVLRCNPFVPGGWDPPEAWSPKRTIKLPWPRPPWPDEAWVIRLDVDDDESIRTDLESEVESATHSAPAPPE